MFKKLFGRQKSEVASTIADSASLMSITGHPELDILFISPTDKAIAGALEGWSWLGLNGLTPILVSAFGEVFFRDEAGHIIQLDTIEGKLRPVAAHERELEELLQHEEARDEMLFAGTVIKARQEGLILNSDECYDYIIAPIIGGNITFENVEKISFLVKLHIAGQIHDQVRDLAPGTKINSFKLEEEL